MDLNKELNNLYNIIEKVYESTEDKAIKEKAWALMEQNQAIRFDMLKKEYQASLDARKREQLLNIMVVVLGIVGMILCTLFKIELVFFLGFLLVMIFGINGLIGERNS